MLIFNVLIKKHIILSEFKNVFITIFQYNWFLLIFYVIRLFIYKHNSQKGFIGFARLPMGEMIYTQKKSKESWSSLITQVERISQTSSSIARELLFGRGENSWFQFSEVLYFRVWKMSLAFRQGEKTYLTVLYVEAHRLRNKLIFTCLENVSGLQRWTMLGLQAH